MVTDRTAASQNSFMARKMDEAEALRRESARRLRLTEEGALRESAIDEMVSWFHENFEDPANDTPWDGEDKQYVYMWGGPFEAGDVMWTEFSGRFDQEWIDAAVDAVESDGTYEWAPSSKSDFYEHPESDGQEEAQAARDADEKTRKELADRILSRLDELEARLVDLPVSPKSIGHNQPPEDIGLPPYNDESRSELEAAAKVVRQEIASEAPDATNLGFAEAKFRKMASAILAWTGRKLDLAVDETIKATVKATAWGMAATLMLGIADDIGRFLGSIWP